MTLFDISHGAILRGIQRLNLIALEQRNAITAVITCRACGWKTRPPHTYAILRYNEGSETLCVSCALKAFGISHEAAA